MPKNLPNSQVVILERREKIWALARGNIKSYEIAKQLNVSPPTVTRDIKFLTAESQNYLNDLARETLPFMYQISIEGIRDIIRECWAIYQTEDHTNINMYQRISALKLAKECTLNTACNIRSQTPCPQLLRYTIHSVPIFSFPKNSD